MEDNLVGSWHRCGRRVVAAGDDTWHALVPHVLHRSHPFPSFDVHDLHTVDDGVASVRGLTALGVE